VVSGVWGGPAPAETGLVLGGFRYRLNEKFLHRWPLKRA